MFEDGKIIDHKSIPRSGGGEENNQIVSGSVQMYHSMHKKEKYISTVKQENVQIY